MYDNYRGRKIGIFQGFSKRILIVRNAIWTCPAENSNLEGLVLSGSCVQIAAPAPLSTFLSTLQGCDLHLTGSLNTFPRIGRFRYCFALALTKLYLPMLNKCVRKSQASRAGQDVSQHEDKKKQV